MPVEVVDVPDQDVNSMGSCIKSVKEKFALNDVLQTGIDIESKHDNNLVDAL